MSDVPAGIPVHRSRFARAGAGGDRAWFDEAMQALTTARAVMEHLGDPHLVLIDVRWTLGGPPGAPEFETGHIPGAHFVDLDSELSGPPGVRGRHPLPDPTVVGMALRRCGVTEESRVVVYDANLSLSAARAWWVFRDVGVGDVSVLDGGLAAWIEAGGQLETGPRPPLHGTFEPAGGRLPRLDADAASWVADNGVLLDARAPERYRGDVEPIDPVAGHIPGAVNQPTTDLLTPSGTFLPADRLRARFAELGIDDETVVGCYCGSGVTAAHQLLALAVAGIDASLYPGSWSEWIGDPSRPVALGAE